VSKPPFKDEEHAFRSYAQMMSRPSLSGIDPIAMRGIEYAKVCQYCKKKKKARSKSPNEAEPWKRQDGVWRCTGFRCGKLRPWKVIGVPRGYFQENVRRHSGHAGVEQLAELGLAFRVLTLWQLRAWWAYVALRDYRRTVHFCREIWPRYVAGWSLHKVKLLVDKARERARPELIRRGLIEY